MSQKLKKSLFLLFFLSFCIIAPLMILYSLGYRFNWKTKTLVQTGAIYIKVRPKKASFYLNDKYIGTTDFLNGSIFKKNILPGTYFVKVEKPGYYIWKKQLKVRKRLVTEAKEIILLPKKISSLVLEKKALDFYVSPSLKRISLVETKTEKEKENLFLIIYELNSDLTKK